MKITGWIILCLFLSMPLSAMAKPDPNQLPLHFAVVMPAQLVETFEEDSAEVYDGVQFPLFCGFASIYPKENKLIFTKVTDLPIVRVEKLLRKIEETGYMEYYMGGFEPLEMPVNHREISNRFGLFAIRNGFQAYDVSWEDEIPLDMVPKFTRTCTFDSKKKPYTDCAYYNGDIDDLRIPYDWEIEFEKKWEQERQAKQKQ